MSSTDRDRLSPGSAAPAVSSSLAKRILPPALYDACMVEAGDPRVGVK